MLASAVPILQSLNIDETVEFYEKQLVPHQISFVR